MLAATNTRFSGSKPSKSRRARDKGRVVGPMEQVRSIFEYIKGRDDKRWQKNERFVTRYPDFTPEPAKLISGGLSTNFKEMWDQIKLVGTDQVMYRYFDISPNTTLMDELPPDLWESVTVATAAKGIEDYCEEKYGNHELNYLMSYQFAVDKDGRPHPHIHLITEGSVFDNGKGERVPFAMYPEHLKRCKDCVDGSFADQLDQTLGQELWQPIYAQWKERIAAEKEQAARDKATRELQETAQALDGIDVPHEPSPPLSLEEVFAPTPIVPEPIETPPTVESLPLVTAADAPKTNPDVSDTDIVAPDPIVQHIVPPPTIEQYQAPPIRTTPKIDEVPKPPIEPVQPLQRQVATPKPPKVAAPPPPVRIQMPPVQRQVATPKPLPKVAPPPPVRIQTPPVQRQVATPKPPKVAAPPPVRIQVPPPQRMERKLLKALPKLHLRREMDAIYAAELSPESGIISMTKTYEELGSKFTVKQPIIRVSDDAEAANYMAILEEYRATNGWFKLMQAAEQAAVDNGFLDKNRVDPCFFTKGPDDPWETLRWKMLHSPTQAQQPSPTPPRQPIVEAEHDEPDKEGGDIELGDGWGEIDR